MLQQVNCEHECLQQRATAHHRTPFPAPPLAPPPPAFPPADTPSPRSPNAGCRGALPKVCWCPRRWPHEMLISGRASRDHDVGCVARS
eukprot:scaffold26237_cov107-Isochrysis_galbana.AAC.4